MGVGSRAAAVGRAVLKQRNLVPENGKPQTAAVPALESSTALRVWTAYGLLLMVATIPLFSSVVPPLFDYPNHLARMHLLVEGGNAFYAVHWMPLPNLAQDLIVPPLARLMPLYFASKLFLIMIFALLAGGAICLNRAATGAWRLWPLLVFLLLYNRVFLWGFVNYLFGIGVALAGVALWLVLEGKHRWLRLATSSASAVACYFSHIAAFGFYALVICGVEAAPAFAELCHGDWRATGRRIAIAGPQFVVPAALFLGSWENLARGPIVYASFWRKADLLFSTFDNYDRAFDIVCFALFLGLICGLAATGRLHVVPRLGWAVGAVFAAYLLLPSQLYGGSGADHRLPTALFVLLVASSEPRLASRRAAVTIAGAAAVILVTRLALVEHVWLRADRIYTADLAGLDLLPPGAKLAVAHPASALNFVPVPEVHFAALAIARREAFVPTLFAVPAQQPVLPRPAYAALAEAVQPQLLWTAFVAEDAAALAGLPAALQQYDYIAFTDNRPVHVPGRRCLAPVFAGTSFQIFAIQHKPGCENSNG
jgi:hypothetical protein